MINRNRKNRRIKRVSENLLGTEVCPRVCMFRSSKYTYGQALNDTNHTVIASFSSLQLKKAKGTKTELAKKAGKELGALLKEKKITAIVFDRRGSNYIGRVQAFADGLRSSGINF